MFILFAWLELVSLSEYPLGISVFYVVLKIRERE